MKHKAPRVTGAVKEVWSKGTPQGGPLSPLLGNIYLDALDKELERREVAFLPLRGRRDDLREESAPRGADPGKHYEMDREEPEPWINRRMLKTACPVVWEG